MCMPNFAASCFFRASSHSSPYPFGSQKLWWLLKKSVGVLRMHVMQRALRCSRAAAELGDEPPAMDLGIFSCGVVLEGCMELIFIQWLKAISLASWISVYQQAVRVCARVRAHVLYVTVRLLLPASVRVYMHLHAFVCVCARELCSLHTFVCTWVDYQYTRTQAHTYTHTYTHAYTSVHTHTHTHTYIHIRVYVLAYDCAHIYSRCQRVFCSFPAHW
jgi:hypothetical protein